MDQERKKTALRGHTGRTKAGSTRDVRIERIGRVTIYKRGSAYYVYYREFGKTVRRRVDGNLATARIGASKVNAAIGEGSPSLFSFRRTSPENFVIGYLDYCENVAGQAFSTVGRYSAALSHFKDFAVAQGISHIDHVNEATVEDFIKWLRRQQRTRNGAEKGERHGYSEAGIKFILSTCRTAMNWARKHQYLPPYGENPFSSLRIERLRKRDTESQPVELLTEDDLKAFFKACDDWQRPIFFVLSVYGLRVGELTHLLVEDIDLKQGLIHVRSKPEMFWHVKTSRERVLPTFPEVKALFEQLIGERKAGFVFVNRGFKKSASESLLTSPRVLREHLARIAAEERDKEGATEQDVRRAVTAFLRGLGQIPEKRIRQEFMKLTKGIGHPELTKAHSMRHLFATRAQEAGMNPFLVQSLLGHASLDMTGRYTHVSMDAKREAMREMFKVAGTGGGE